MLSRPSVGVATWVFGERPLADTAAFIAILAQVDGVTVAPDVGEDEPERMRQLLQQYDLALFGVTPANVDLAHPDEAVREEAIVHYKRLIDFAAAVGAPFVAIRPFLGRRRPLTTAEDEYGWWKTAVSQCADYAARRGQRLALEVVNRYESFLLNTAVSALNFLDEINASNINIVLSAFHMNIEEQDAAGVVRQVGERCAWLHVSDSNRSAIGQGHLKLGMHLWAIQDIPQEVPIILEILPPQIDFAAVQHTPDSLKQLEEALRTSANWF